MASARMLRLSRPILGHGLPNGLSLNLVYSSMVYRPRTLICLDKVGLSSENPPGGERKPVAAKATGCPSSAGVLISEPKTGNGVDLPLLMAYIGDKMSQWVKLITRERPWRFHIQMFVEKAIVDCRFFTLLATAGSLLGSVLCLVEGCFLIMESYVEYFHSLSQMSDQGHVVLLLIEAIDMFLVGTSMLVFGVALHVMFMGQDKFSQHSNSTLSRYFNPKKIPSWIGMESAVEAKSKIGHAVIMILQVQGLEKFKSIRVGNGMDLACFAAAVLLSSAAIFVLSRIAVVPSRAGT